MDIVLISLVSIIVIYFAVALSPLKVCALCSAVSLTWIGLLAAYLLGLYDEILWIGVLMGGSVVGLMYKLDQYWQRNSYTGTWLLKLSIVVFGFLFVYVVIMGEWQVFFWLTPLAVVIMVVSFMLLHKNINQQKISSGLQDKLDHCCD